MYTIQHIIWFNTTFFQGATITPYPGVMVAPRGITLHCWFYNNALKFETNLMNNIEGEIPLVSSVVILSVTCRQAEIFLETCESGATIPPIYLTL